MSDKPAHREFWINDDAEGDGTKSWSDTPWFGYVHVVEMSALTETKEEIEAYKIAVEHWIFMTKAIAKERDQWKGLALKAGSAIRNYYEMPSYTDDDLFAVLKVFTAKVKEMEKK